MSESNRLLLALFKMTDSGSYDRRTFEQVREYLDTNGLLPGPCEEEE